MNSGSNTGELMQDSGPTLCFVGAEPYADKYTAKASRYVELLTEIVKFLDGKSLVMVALSCKWFYRLLVEDSVWRNACLRHLGVPDTQQSGMKWIKLYASAFDGSHTFTHRQKDKHLDWFRVGSFLFESSVAFLTQSMQVPRNIQEDETIEKTLQLSGCCLLKNVKTGIWLADLHLLHCPVCGWLTRDGRLTCDGNLLILEARHIELFLYPEYNDGSWDYEMLGSTMIKKSSTAATGAIVDFKHLNDESTAGVFNIKSRVGKEVGLKEGSFIIPQAVAFYTTNLGENEGIHVKFYAMRAGKEGDVVSIRISYQLL